jgi:uncharacterized membrane protein
MTLILFSIIINVVLYILIGIIVYKVIISTSAPIFKTPDYHQKHYEGFIALMSALWPILLVIFIFASDDYANPL